MLSEGIRIWGLEGIPEIKPGDDLCRSIVSSLGEYRVERGILFVVAQKVISKAEGRIVQLDSVVPSTTALEWAAKYNKDARMVEVVFREARRIVRMDRGVLIVETHHGFVCANAGVDVSNAPKGTVILLPADPDLSAAKLRAELEQALKAQIAVIISDTFGRPWRQGLTNIALGAAGFSPVIDYRGQLDSYGRSLQSTVLAVADELAAAAELVMGKTLGIPVAVVEGFQFTPASGSARELIRPPEEDLFR
jgi:coenzyme F420-0:L-glutamate ligase/coenzyme F420-1:gamma-L-glutamate ligase